MIDIVCFEGEKFNLGFSKIYYYQDFNIIIGENDIKNRKAVSDKKVDILLGPERLNQVLCKLAHENQVAIGFSFNDILNAKERFTLIAKIQKNIRLCRKYKVKMVFASFAKDKYEMRNAKDLLSLAIVLGMTGKEAKEALNFKKKDLREIKIVK